ncbi:MAG: response regulator [Bacteroidia bacterium]|nr:response regulator [Bacteroidia bacterium]MDW8158037.1 response regulator [Bacteroidia bacterium]
MAKPVILLIDDDKTVLNSLMDQLRSAFKNDYTIEAVQTISEAREVLNILSEQNIEVKVVIADWLMPPDRTNDLLVEIHSRYPNIAIIMLSGYADEAAIEHARKNANLQVFIRKPWEEDNIITEVKKFL